MKPYITALASAILIFSNAAFANTNNSPVSDATITQNVQTKIAAEKALADQTISVNTDGGVVALTGNLKTSRQATVAIEAAESTAGVKDVDTSNLTVKNSKHPVTDSVITAKVKGSFLQEKLFGDTNVPVVAIHVDTKNGVVHLTGKADNQEQRSKAITLAQSVKGVKKVDSKITLNN